ncbi:MAG: hypothetical protein IJK39_04800 [Bacteroidales bacterium]|nr:hypothetical protein [Bacteroidales bacterium]
MYNDTILKCNVRERWESIDTVEVLSPARVKFMTTYSNDKYLGLFERLVIDSTEVRSYYDNFMLFRKGNK